MTTIADTFDHTDDAWSLSLREAIDLTNTAGGQREIWLPAWEFVLTRDRGVNPSDYDIAFGDLNIMGGTSTRNLTIRGVDGVSSVRWNAAVADEVFKLVGDYDGDFHVAPIGSGRVEAADYTIWADAISSGVYDAHADGNEDGVIDQVDYDIWVTNFGNTLDLFGVQA